VVTGARPVTVVEEATPVVPAPRLMVGYDGTCVPKESLHVPGLVVEYMNQPCVESPFGMVDAFSVAELAVNAVAASVVTVGGASVVNDDTEPKAVPWTFDAIAQK
jgi:hypothetical protein